MTGNIHIMFADSLQPSNAQDDSNMQTKAFNLKSLNYISPSCSHAKFVCGNFLNFPFLIRYASKTMQQFIEFVRHFLIRNRATLLWLVREAPRYEIAVLLAKCATIQQTRRIFTAKGATIQQKAHCGGVIKVQHF